jgi:(R,R)-butanediol dehydrogenase/meso-butanediol dehydrogenase/diacetyl reductase
VKAAVTVERNRFAVREVPTPQAGRGQVLIRVAFCGICGSDLVNMKPASPGYPLGVTPGHEWVGTIAGLGEGVTRWKPGDRVVMRGYPDEEDPGPEMMAQFLQDPTIALGVHPIVRAGGFAEYLVWPATRLARVPDTVSDEEAALTDPLAVGLHGVRESGLKLGDSVIIIGAGPIGLSALLGARIAGASRVYVTELMEARKSVAAELGADRVYDPSKGDVRLPLLEATNGGADVVFDCVGSQATIQQSVDVVKTRGTVVLLGLSIEPVQIKPLVWFAKAVCYQVPEGGAVPQVLELLEQGRLNAAPMITQVVPLEELQQTFESLLQPAEQIKVLVRP